MTNDEILREIRCLHEKIDRVLSIVEGQRPSGIAQRPPKPKKEKLLPLSEQEIKDHQARFQSLFERWLEGHELDVQNELEQLNVEQLRRFGDANNLNVTSKMPKQKLLHLIGSRFREKRQLHQGSLLRRESGT